MCSYAYHIFHVNAVCGCEYGCVVWCVWSRVLQHGCHSGSVQRLHRTQTQHADLHWTHLLPEAEAHGGRQDPLQSQRACAGADQTAYGGKIQVRTRWIVASRDRDGFVFRVLSVYCCDMCLLAHTHTHTHTTHTSSFIPGMVVFVLVRWREIVRLPTELLSS